jgi:hypothetical protein
MRVVREEITIYPMPAAHEVHIVLDGMKIVLTKDEVERVARDLTNAAAALQPAEKPAATVPPGQPVEAPSRAVAASEGDALLERLVRTVEPRADPPTRRDAPARAR